MKKNINTGVLVVNYLASCGKTEVATLDLVKAVMPGCRNEEDMDKAFGNILPVLTNLASGGLVKLSTEAIPSTGFVPKVIHILPKMKKAADRLTHGEISGGKDSDSAKGRPGKSGEPSAEAAKASRSLSSKRRQDAIDERYNVFADLFEKKRRLVRIRGEWNRLIASMVYQDIEEETGFNACVKSFVNGLIWEKRREHIGSRNEPAGKPEKADPPMRPELQRLIDEIVKAEETKNGPLKEGRKNRRIACDADASLVRLDRDEIRDFMHCVHNMRDDIQPDRVWRDAVSRFMGEMMQNLPVYEACMESFRAGIIWQMHRKKLEGQD